jgi:diguanylate cyclase (GGDEF)-like protein/PAS domain S-box-containing protein
MKKRSSQFQKASNRDIRDIALFVVDHIPAMVAYWDTNQTCRFANNAYLEWFGKSRDQLIGITLKELLGPIYPKNLPYILEALKGKVQNFEREIPTPRGVRHSMATYTPDIVDGAVRGFFVHVGDVTLLKQLESELKAAKERAEILATHDFLTGLPNRVLLKDRISRAMALAKRKDRMIAVMSLDMDEFKQINDNYGHAEGDNLLREIAVRVRKTIQESDTVTRIGGDEFILLAPEVMSENDVEGLARRVLESVRQPFRCKSDTITPTFSIGIALYPRNGVTPEALIASSDQGMYKAKRLGKNQFAWADENQG